MNIDTHCNLIQNKSVSSHRDSPYFKPAKHFNLLKVNDLIKYIKSGEDKYNLNLYVGHKSNELSDVVNEKNKDRLCAIQIFLSDKRERKYDDNPDYDPMTKWNGFVVVDVDSKNYTGKYEKVLKNVNFPVWLHERLCELPTYNYFGMQQSFSGNSFHIFFKYDIEHNIEQFGKAARHAEDMVRMVFERSPFKEIIKNKNVIDNCTLKNPFQPVYLTDYEFFINEECTGSVYWYGKENCLDEYILSTPETPIGAESSDIKFINYIKWPENYINPFESWEHSVRLSFISVLSLYTEGDKPRARAIYNKFVNDFIDKLPADERNNHSHWYFMSKFDAQFDGISKYSQVKKISKTMIRFFRTNFSIEIEARNAQGEIINLADVKESAKNNTQKNIKKIGNHEIKKSQKKPITF